MVSNAIRGYGCVLWLVCVAGCNGPEEMEEIGDSQEVEAAAKKKGCPPGTAECDGLKKTRCETNVASNVKNCGSCGIVCPSGPSSTATCTSGRCGLTCAGGFGTCDANPANGCEANLDTDNNNCGACGNVCATSCQGGSCILGCPPGVADCDGNPANGCETNILIDPNNCGGCGLACDNACVNGVCL